jgi:hypothetical protein
MGELMRQSCGNPAMMVFLPGYCLRLHFIV